MVEMKMGQQHVLQFRCRGWVVAGYLRRQQDIRRRLGRRAARRGGADHQLGLCRDGWRTYHVAHRHPHAEPLRQRQRQPLRAERIAAECEEVGRVAGHRLGQQATPDPRDQLPWIAALVLCDRGRIASPRQLGQLAPVGLSVGGQRHPVQ